MSTTIDEKVVEMRFDNEKFEKNVAQSMSTLDKLKAKLNFKDAAKSFEELENKTSNISFDKMAQSVEAIEKRFSTMGIVGMRVIQNLTDGTMHLVSKAQSFISGGIINGGLNRATNIINAQFQLQGLLKDGNAVSAVMKNVSDSVDGTAYSMDAAASVASQLAASGMRAGDEMFSALRGVAGVAAMTNSSYEDIGRIYTQVAGQGKLMGDQLLQLSGRGMNAAATLATYLGKSEAEVRDMTSKGQIDFATFAAAMDSAFGEHAKEANSTFDGALANIRSALARTGQAFFLPLKAVDGPFVKLFNAIRTQVNNINTILSPATTELSNKIGKVVESFAELIEKADLTPVANTISNVITAAGNLVSKIDFSKITAKITGASNPYSDLAAKIKEVTTASTVSAEAVQDLGDVVNRVINGEFGNAPERYEKLTAAGFDWTAVQNKVNEQLGDSTRHEEAAAQAQESLAQAQAVTIESLKEMSDEQLKNIGFTDDQVTAFRELEEQSKKTGIPIEDLMNNVDRLSAKSLIFDSFKNIGDSLINTLKSIGSAWNETFSVKDIGNTIYSAIEAFHKLTVTFAVTDERAEKIKRTFKGVFSLIDLLVNVIKSGLSIGFKVLNDVMGASNVGILDITAAIGDFISGIDEAVKDSNVFTKFVDNISSGINKIKEAFDSIKKKIDTSSLVTFLSSLTKVLANVGTNIISSFRNLFSNISGMFGESSIFNVINDVLYSGILVKIIDFLNTLKKTEKDSTGIISNIKSVLTNVNNCLKAYQKDIQANTILKIAGAIATLSVSILLLSTINEDDLAKSLAGLTALFVELTVSMKQIGQMETSSKGTMKIVATLLSLSIAVAILSGVAKTLGSMSWEELGKAGAGILGLITMLVAAAKIMSGSSALGFSVSMLLMAAALNAIVPVLLALGKMKITEIVQALGALASVFAVIGIAGALLKSVVPAILGLSVSLALLGVGVVGIGAGLQLIAVGLTALAVAVSTSQTIIVAGLQAIILGFIDLIPSIAVGIATGIVKIVQTLSSSTVDIAEALFDFVLGTLVVLKDYVPDITATLLELLIEAINALADHTPELILALGNLLAKIFAGVRDALSTADTTQLLQGVASVAIMTLLVSALASVTSMIPMAMVGLVGVGVLIAELSLILAAIGQLNKIPGLQEAISDGGELLGAIGYAIGNFIGSILGGVGAGISTGLPEIADNLSQFGEKIQPFVASLNSIGDGFVENVAALSAGILMLTAAEFVSGVASFLSGGSSFADMGSELSSFIINAMPFITSASLISTDMMEGVKALAQTILILTAADLIEGISSWITGGSSISDFSEQLVPFGEAIAAFSSAVNGKIDEESVIAAANAGRIMAEMADVIPNTGGVAGFFAGENDIDTFGDKLESFGESIVAFSDAVAGNIDEDAITSAANAGRIMAEMADIIPNTGGVAGFFAGDNDIGDFGEKLKTFGKAMVDFSESAKGIDTDAVTVAANVGQMMAELNEMVPDEGGVKGWWFGDNDMSDFGDNIADFGEGIAKFSESVSGKVSEETVSAALTASNKLVYFAKNVKDVEFDGLENFESAVSYDYISIADSLETLSNTINDGFDSKAIDKALESCQSLVSFASELSTADMSSLDDFGKTLKSFSKQLAGVDTSGLSSFASQMKGVGDSGVNGVLSAFKSSSAKASAAGSELAKGIGSGITKGSSAITKAITDVVKKCLNAVSKEKSSFSNAMRSLMNAMATAASSNKSAISNNVSSAVRSAVSAAQKYKTDFYSVGKNFVNGMAKGISDNDSVVSSKVRSMAKKAVTAAQKELDIHSPSRVMQMIGKFVPMGFAKGIEEFSYMVTNSSRSMASTVTDATSMALASFQALVDNNKDWTPTITPVVDMSNVENSASTIDSLFSGDHSFGVKQFASPAINRMRSRNQNDGNADVVSAINKLRGDISGMSKPTYQIDGITYDDRSSVADAIDTLIDAIVVERRN